MSTVAYTFLSEMGFSDSAQKALTGDVGVYDTAYLTFQIWRSGVLRQTLQMMQQVTLDTLVTKGYLHLETSIPGSVPTPVAVGIANSLLRTNDQVTLKASSSIGAAVFTGTGVNNATFGGTYSGVTDASHYEVEIDATGTPDTFKWRKDTGSYTTGVAITGSAQTLAEGVTVTFATTTGHTLAGNWKTLVNVTEALVYKDVNGTTVFELDQNGVLKILGTQMLKPQIATGWVAPTGTLSAATFVSDSVTLPNLAARVAQLIIDLKAQGIIG